MIAVMVVSDTIMVVMMPDLERVRQDVGAERDERGDGQSQGQCRVQ